MKKKISLVLCVLILLVCLTGCGTKSAKEIEPEKPFELRNGILMGDSVEDVLSKETLEIASKSTDEIITKRGTFAEVDFDYCQYKFSDGKLKSVVWKADWPNTLAPSVYFSTLSKGLQNKYGEPSNTDVSKFNLYHGSAIDYMFYSMGELIALELSLGKAGIDHLNEWIIDCGGNGHVKIDLFAFHEYEDGYLLVSYDYFTDEEFSELTKEDMSYSDDL